MTAVDPPCDVCGDPVGEDMHLPHDHWCRRIPCNCHAITCGPCCWDCDDIPQIAAAAGRADDSAVFLSGDYPVPETHTGHVPAAAATSSTGAGTRIHRTMSRKDGQMGPASVPDTTTTPGAATPRAVRTPSSQTTQEYRHER